MINWCHHWRLPDGRISVSVGTENEYHWIRFPELIDFKLHTHKNKIVAYRPTHIPDNTVCHLLLDQVIPRLLSHHGKLIIHASCVQVGDYAIAFCGESGRGKSTLAAYFFNSGYKLLTDDCLLLETDGSNIIGTPNYQGLRLLDDSIAFISRSKMSYPCSNVCHYGSKKRVAIPYDQKLQTTPLSTVFFLRAPSHANHHPTIPTTKVAKSSAVIEFIKHSFPLNITDPQNAARQFTNFAHIVNKTSTNFMSLNYPHKIELLPFTMESILRVNAKSV